MASPQTAISGIFEERRKPVTDIAEYSRIPQTNDQTQPTQPRRGKLVSLRLIRVLFLTMPEHAPPASKNDCASH